jgi:RNA polymerase sigma-70 factor (ECF subfamily)
MQNMTDEELMLSYQEGNMQVMEEFLKRYKNPIYHFVLRLSWNAQEAEDLTQEVFLRLHQYRDDYRPIAKFSTWLFTIAHNLSVSRLRKKKWAISWPRSNDGAEELVEFESPAPSPREITANQEVSEKIKECIQGLPFLQKEALVLREYEKMDYQEISIILHTPLSTVKNLIHRARMNLKDKLISSLKEIRGGNDV